MILPRSLSFYEDLYVAHLTTLNGIPFTRREIDVIACLLNARGTSKIASFLSIALRTVMTHIRNIMRKIDCNSREEILEFLEKSEAVVWLREYYASLVAESLFQKTLKDIAKLKPLPSPERLLIVCPDEALKRALLHRFPVYLKQVGGIHQTALVFVETGGAGVLDLTASPKYYAASFEILKILFPNVSLEALEAHFWDQMKGLQSLTSASPPPIPLPALPHPSHPPSLLQTKWGSFLYIFSLICLASISITVFKAPPHAQSSDYQSPQSIRCDFILPPEGSLLSRQAYIAQMEKKLCSQRGIRTLALLGAGGAGKTTLARQYAAQQKVRLVWELNAESSESLYTSFVELAQALVQTEEDQKILREIKETPSLSEQEEKLLHFVKERFHRLSNWLLIYDNVENIGDLQKYFPQDKETWGAGTVILTSLNSNLQNNRHIRETLSIRELNPAEKLDLFVRIMNHGNPHALTPPQKAEARQFLEHIPSFPLDVSVAAYYLKNMNPSYEGYLANLNKASTEFDYVQYNLLREAGSYTNTRYQIVTLSLQQLLSKHPDFKELLMLISLLNSQDIPRELLSLSKGNAVADHFITSLKKYSLINTDLPSSKLTDFSIHRSTQSIALHFLLEHTDPATLPVLLETIVHALEQDIEKYVTTETFPALKNLALHCETLLKHHKLFPPALRGRIKAELARIDNILSESLPKQQERLEDLAGSSPFYARTLAYKGIFLWDAGDFYEQAAAKRGDGTLEDALRSYLVQALYDVKLRFLNTSPPVLRITQKLKTLEGPRP